LNRFDLDFDNLDDQKPAQTIELDEEFYFSDNKEIEFQGTQFYSADSIALFVEGNLGDQDTSVIHYVQIIGGR
jgi:hypothetical protein